jgi:hypothetical protein
MPSKFDILLLVLATEEFISMGSLYPSGFFRVSRIVDEIFLNRIQVTGFYMQIIHHGFSTEIDRGDLKKSSVVKVVLQS